MGRQLLHSADGQLLAWDCFFRWLVLLPLKLQCYGNQQLSEPSQIVNVFRPRNLCLFVWMEIWQSWESDQKVNHAMYWAICSVGEKGRNKETKKEIRREAKRETGIRAVACLFALFGTLVWSTSDRKLSRPPDVVAVVEFWPIGAKLGVRQSWMKSLLYYY